MKKQDLTPSATLVALPKEEFVTASTFRVGTFSVMSNPDDYYPDDYRRTDPAPGVRFGSNPFTGTFE